MKKTPAGAPDRIRRRGPWDAVALSCGSGGTKEEREREWREGGRTAGGEVTAGEWGWIG